MKKHLILMTVAATLLTSCGGSKTTTAESRQIWLYSGNNLLIYRYCVIKFPGFEELTLKQKELIYYLTEAALGRKGYSVLTRTESITWESVGCSKQYIQTIREIKQRLILKIWRCIWKGYGSPMVFITTMVRRNLCPTSRRSSWNRAVLGIDAQLLPLAKGQTAEQLCAELFPVIFDPTIMPKRGKPGRWAKILCWLLLVTIMTEWRRKRQRVL